MIRLELTVVAILLGWWAVWNCGMFAITLLRALRWRKQARLSAALQPLIHQEIAVYLSGADDLTKLKEFCRKSRRDVADALMSFRKTVGGSARDRLCEFTIEQTLIHDWCADAKSKDPILRRPAFARLAFVCAYEPCRRVAGDFLEKALNDADPEVRFYAWRSLVQSGTIPEIEELFHAALSQSLLIRILLTEELRRFAVPLCERAVMKALKSDDRERVLACLEMLVAWERAVPVPDLHALIDSSDRRIRIQALHLAPLVPLEPADLGAILRALVGDDTDAATAAAMAAGRLRFDRRAAAGSMPVTSSSSTVAFDCRRSTPRIGWAISAGDSAAVASLIEQRLKQVIIVAVDHRHIDRRSRQTPRRGEPAKAGADDDHPRSRAGCSHRRGPAARLGGSRRRRGDPSRCAGNDGQPNGEQPPGAAMRHPRAPCREDLQESRRQPSRSPDRTVPFATANAGPRRTSPGDHPSFVAPASGCRLPWVA